MGFRYQQPQARGNASAADLLAGKKATVYGGKLIDGLIAVRQIVPIMPADSAQDFPEGFYKGGFQVKAASAAPAPVYTGTAAASDMLEGKTATVSGGNVITGTIPTKTGAVAATGSAQWGNGDLAAYIPNNAYYAGAEVRITVAQLKAAAATLAAGNIRNGVTIYGVTGTYGSDATAAASQILNGQTAYGSSGKITGTMPKQAAGARPGPAAVAPYQGSIYMKVPPGYYYEDDVYLGYGDANFVSANIKQGVSVLGLVGTMPVGFTISPGNNTLLSFTNGTNYGNGSYETRRKIRVGVSGTYRLLLNLIYIGGSNLPYCRVLKNGGIIVNEFYGGSGAGTNHEFDIACNSNDLIEVQAYAPNGSTYRIADVQLRANLTGIATLEA